MFPHKWHQIHMFSWFNHHVSNGFYGKWRVLLPWPMGFLVLSESSSHPSSIPLNPGWLRTGFPVLGISYSPIYQNPSVIGIYWDILGYMKGSIIPELIINRQGYRSQPLRKMWFSPFLLPSPGCRLLGFSSFSVCRCSRQKLQSWMHLAEMWTATEKIGSSWDFNGILMGF